jgi:PAS domain S-box-containing protein
MHRAIIETAADGIIVIGADGRIDSVNAAVERLFGWAADELVGQNVSVLMPEPFRSEHDAYIRRYLQGREARIIGHGREVVARRKGGASFPIHLAVAEMDVGGQRMFTGIISDLTERNRAEAELRRIELRGAIAAEQASLRRVATAVARETDPTRIFDLVAKEAAGHLGVALGLVCRFGVDRSVIVGQWSSGPRISARSLPKDGDGALAQVARTEAPGRVDDYGSLGEDPAALVATEFSASVAAPIFSPDGLWGAILVSTTLSTPFPPEAEGYLAEFAELVTMAIANAADRARLISLTATDPLTGLANHRAFHERLRGEVRRAARHRRPLALVMLDVDHFKQVNDVYGHATGDTVLIEIAKRLLAQTREGEVLARVSGEEFAWLLPDTDITGSREGEVLARVGGEEFAWILPDTGITGAREAAERARRAIGDVPFPTAGTVTISAGTCDLARAGDAEQLLLFADGALYWAKHQGRNTVCEYDQGVTNSLSSEEHVAYLERTQAVTSVRALARAVDAKDPTTREHSTRVAEMAVRLASTRGWDADRIARLYEAGVLHDVGKIGVPDIILFKQGQFTPAEYELLKQHAELGERIVTDIVTAEQAAWIRNHHERFDGTGYPDGLVGLAIPEGARLLTLADAWDVMTSERPYKVGALSVTESLEECRRLAGIQFCPKAVDALEHVYGDGGL